MAIAVFAVMLIPFVLYSIAGTHDVHAFSRAAFLAGEDLIRQERISTIGRLSGSIVHDLRNPLAAIYGGAEMLVDGDLPPAHVKRLAGNIYRASRRIQELLQDLLNVSRGKTTTPELCRLREVALAATESLTAAAEGQGVHVDVSIPPEIEVPPRIRM